MGGREVQGLFGSLLILGRGTEQQVDISGNAGLPEVGEDFPSCGQVGPLFECFQYRLISLFQPEFQHAAAAVPEPTAEHGVFQLAGKTDKTIPLHADGVF